MVDGARPERQIGSRKLRLERGDITRVLVDAIVNAANEYLAPGGGVSGAIHRAGGPEIERECRQVGHCPTGQAVATGAGQLPARHVVHAVAPRWKGGHQGEPKLLASAYRRSLEVADSIGARSLAFPSLGTGIFGYPVELAAPVALGSVADYLSHHARNVEEVSFVLFSDNDLAVYHAALDRLVSP